MESLAPVLANAGIAGAFCAWLMLRVEKRLDRQNDAQYQVAIQMVKFRAALPDLSEAERADAQADVAALQQRAAAGKEPPPASGGFIAQALNLLGVR